MRDIQYLTYQDQYALILEELLFSPYKTVESRNGKINSVFKRDISVDLTKEFPLMEIKWLKFSNILKELLWFYYGKSNIKELIENNCNIWNDDAYKYYNRKYVPLGCPEITKESFIIKTLNGERFRLGVNEYYVYGDMDRVYGVQWRDFNGKTDQISNVIETLKTNPESRRMVVTAHNPSDIEDNNVGLPSCHNMFQLYTIPISDDERYELYYNKTNKRTTNESDLDKENIPRYYVNIWFNLRSNDWFLGQPYNMASYSILLYMIAQEVNMIPKFVESSIIDCHLYTEHIKPSKKWLERYANMKINSESTLCKSNLIMDVDFNKIRIDNYNPQSYIKAKLLT